MHTHMRENLPRRLLLSLIDYGLCVVGVYVALLMRLGFDFRQVLGYSSGVFICSAIIVGSFWLIGVYKVVWGYADLKDLLRVMWGILLGNLIFSISYLFARRVLLPRSVIFLTFFNTLFLIEASRLFWALYNQSLSKGSKHSEKRILIVGAGRAGIQLLEEFQRRTHLGNVVGFVDDMKRKLGRHVRGKTVLGTTDEIADIVQKMSVDEVIIAIPSASSERIREIVSKINMKVVRVKVLPGLSRLIDKSASISMLKNVEIEDLLARDTIKIDLRSVGEYITNKTILVTGGGGSIGSEICRQVGRLHPGMLLVLGKGENSVYEILEELKETYPAISIIPVIADVCDANRIRSVFKRYKPDIVFHAAAHKHVPLMELNPTEAFKVNLFGTNVVVNACEESGVERMVFISTDKAVNPTNVMGLSKRMAELLVLSRGKTSKTRFAVVRFGNVLGSRGSVIPKFKKQIEKGGPVTVTHPDMERFFMTIPEAVSLVIQAGAYANGGNLFVLNMGEQVKISKLASDMILLSGFVPDQDIKIEYTDIRPGEKLSEELFYADEEYKPTENRDIFVVTSNNNPSSQDFDRRMEEMKRCCDAEDLEGIRKIALELVPTMDKRLLNSDHSSVDKHSI